MSQPLTLWKPRVRRKGTNTNTHRCIPRYLPYLGRHRNSTGNTTLGYSTVRIESQMGGSDANQNDGASWPSPLQDWRSRDQRKDKPFNTPSVVYRSLYRGCMASNWFALRHDRAGEILAPHVKPLTINGTGLFLLTTLIMTSIAWNGRRSLFLFLGRRRNGHREVLVWTWLYCKYGITCPLRDSWGGTTSFS